MREVVEWMQDPERSKRWTTYYTGYLAKDLLGGRHMSDDVLAEAREVARYLLALAELEVVHLAAKRLGDWHYAYQVKRKGAVH